MGFNSGFKGLILKFVPNSIQCQYSVEVQRTEKAVKINYVVMVVLFAANRLIWYKNTTVRPALNFHHII